MTYNDNTCTSGRCTSFKTPDDGRLRPKHLEWLCRNKTWTVLHQVGVSFDLYYDARKLQIKTLCIWQWIGRVDCTAVTEWSWVLNTVVIFICRWFWLLYSAILNLPNRTSTTDRYRGLTTCFHSVTVSSYISFSFHSVPFYFKICVPSFQVCRGLPLGTFSCIVELYTTVKW